MPAGLSAASVGASQDAEHESEGKHYACRAGRGQLSGPEYAFDYGAASGPDRGQSPVRDSRDQFQTACCRNAPAQDAGDDP